MKSEKPIPAGLLAACDQVRDELRRVVLAVALVASMVPF